MIAMVTPPTAAALPDRLVARDQWVCWRTQQRNDKPTKVPIIPETTQFASTTDPDTWREFTTAREAVAATDVDGLGFVFTVGDPLVGVDLDDCRDPQTGTPADWAADVIAQLESYTEVSPSGTGYHVLVRGDRPEGRNRAGEIELYDRSRFFTVTGDHVADTPTAVEARGDALATVHADHVAADNDRDTAAADRPESPNDPTTGADTHPTDSTGPDSLSDDELLDRARAAANGEKFSRLWNGSTTGYASHSEADMALCSLLAFWTGGDPARVDRLFRQSGLYREKWDAVHYADGTTYGAKTVERAVRRVDETYTPGDSDTASAATAPTTDTATSGGASTATADTAAAEPATPPDTSSDTPATKPTATAEMSRTAREQAQLDRIDELTDRIEALVAENERLRAELAAARDQQPDDDSEPAETPVTSWWPFS